MGRHPFAVAGLLLLLPAACSDPERTDIQYRIAKTEGERDQVRLALDDESAKVAILQEQLAAEKEQREIDRAEVNLARDRVRQLDQANDELLALLEQRTRVASERSRVSASPLPNSVDRRLRQFAARHSGRVWYDPGRAAISLANDRLFEPGADQVRAAAQALLGELAGIAAELPAEGYEVIIVGHTDDTPISSPATLTKHASNWHLSVHRAIAVKNVLVSAGLPERRTGVMGYGPHRPIGDEKPRNRRVEVFFARKGEVRVLAPIHFEPQQ